MSKPNFKVDDRVLITGITHHGDNFIGQTGIVEAVGTTICGVRVIGGKRFIAIDFKCIELLPPRKITIRRKEVKNAV